MQDDGRVEVSGVAMDFRLSAESIDPGTERAALPDPAAGAFVAFEGWVRNEHKGRLVRALEYEAYAPLAEKEGARILSAAAQEFSLLQIAGVHRVGYLEVGECAIWIGISAGHRQEAFAACAWVMNRFKETVPIWKKEYFVDGASEWVRGAG